VTPEEAKRDADLRRLYGITLADYRRLLTHQAGVCAVCGRPPVTRALHVDHDHRTKVVRGLLCHACNRLLVGRQRDPEKLRAAARYLEAPPAVAVLGPTVVPAKRRRAKRAARATARRPA
jgi:hypothetical protein